MRIYKCNKCDFKSNIETDFAIGSFYLPEDFLQKKPKNLNDKFHEKEKKLDESEFIATGLKEYKDDSTTQYPITIHLCPKHTVWFSNLFLPNRKGRPRRQKV